MSSKIIVDTIEKKTGDDVTLVGNLDVPTSYKITGTDADSIQAPGLITSAGGGLNTSLNTGLASATYNGTIGSSATFPVGHVIQTVAVIKDDENSASNSSTSLTKVVDSSGNAEWRATINNVSSGNDIIVSASFTIRVGHTQDQHGISMGFIRDTGTPSNSGGTDVYESTSGHGMIYLDGRGAFGGGSGELVRYETVHLMFVDINVSGSTTFNYYLGAEVQSTSTGIIVRSDNPPNFPFYMTLQEIQR